MERKKQKTESQAEFEVRRGQSEEMILASENKILTSGEVVGVVENAMKNFELKISTMLETLQTVSTNSAATSQELSSNFAASLQVKQRYKEKFDSAISKLKENCKSIEESELRSYKEEFYFNLNNYNPNELKNLFNELKNRLNNIKQLKENRNKGRGTRSRKERLKDNRTLVNLLLNKKHLRKATQNEKGKEYTKNYTTLLESIPNRFINYLENEGLRTSDGNKYDRANIRQTIEDIIQVRKNSFWRNNKTQIAALFVGLAVSGSLWFYYPLLVQKRNSVAQTAQIFAQSGKQFIEVSQSKINQFFNYFQSNTLSNEEKLQSIELKIITDKYEFYNYYAPLALAACKGTKLDARIPLIQAFMECGGKSELFANYNNILGIQKGTDWYGKIINYKTTEVINGKDTTMNIDFRVYPTVYDCFKDYISKLRKSWYKGILTKSTPQEQAKCLLMYSTRREVYVNKILEELENFELEISQ